MVMELMDNSNLFPAVALAISVIFLYSLIHKYYSSSSSRAARKLNLPPQAGGAWPIIGHLHLLTGRSETYKALSKMADEYGPIYLVKMGLKRAIVVSNAELIKECLKTNNEAFANRQTPMSLATRVLGYEGAFFVYSPYNRYLRKIRRIVLSESLSASRVEASKRIRESEVNTAVKGVFDRISGNGGVLVDIEKWFDGIFENIIFRMIVGKRYSEAAAILGCGEKSGEVLREKLRTYIIGLGEFAVSDSIPFLRWWDALVLERNMKKIGKEVDSILQGWLDEYKEKRKKEINNSKQQGEVEVEDDEEERCLMDSLIPILDDDDNITSTYEADFINKAVALILLLGGIDPVTGTLTWAVTLLLNNREAVKKAHQELDQHVGKERLVEQSDTDNLVYIQAIMKEALRLFPPAPIPLPVHESTEDCVVGGYHIPAYTRLMIVIARIQRDPKVWGPDANEFRPERYFTTHKGIDVRGDNYELIPFISGKRGCPGIDFALKGMHLALASLLQAFELTTPGDEPVDMTEAARGLTNHIAVKVEAFLTPRLPARLYQH